MKKDNIYKHWEKNAIKFRNSYEVSWGDMNMINLEIETIRSFIMKGAKVIYN